MTGNLSLVTYDSSLPTNDYRLSTCACIIPHDFEVGYKERCDEIYEYLGRFKNLHITGRSGMFRYYNMDHAIESGIKTAERIIKNSK